ncbi:uncharacterized protein LOC131968096 [Centropristis striata]|uniref:uncharacterized protein LOC131968096 n=1 Tax=Centropristis striata TaxID=184440 RepID=UPI0027DEBBCF|nr:uncharacterized protein LOC131968096 [Centropristis striata]
MAGEVTPPTEVLTVSQHGEACDAPPPFSPVSGLMKTSETERVIHVKEDSDVVLPCSLSTKENIEFKLFDWKKAAQKDEPMKEVFFYDAGVHHNNGREVIVHIVFTGACPKPSVRIFDQTKDGVLLQCEVNGTYPKPELQWKDSAGNNLTAGEPQVTEITEKDGTRYDVTLKITVTRSDYFRCVATQPEIYNQIASDKIYASPKVKNRFPTWIIVGLVLGLVLSVVAVVACFKLSRKSKYVKATVSLYREPPTCKTGPHHEENVSCDLEPGMTLKVLHSVPTFWDAGSAFRSPAGGATIRPYLSQDKMRRLLWKPISTSYENK